MLSINSNNIIEKSSVSLPAIEVKRTDWTRIALCVAAVVGIVLGFVTGGIAYIAIPLAVGLIVLAHRAKYPSVPPLTIEDLKKRANHDSEASIRSVSPLLSEKNPNFKRD